MGMRCGICGAPRTPANLACLYCGSAFPDASVVAPRASVGGAPPGVIEAIDEGKLILAIKRYREATRCDLRTAKEACEDLQRRCHGGR